MEDSQMVGFSKKLVIWLIIEAASK
jgi:hypothetical protein